MKWSAGKILITMLLLAKSIMAHTQQKQITGQLKSATGGAITDASVLLTNHQGLVLKFGTSDGHGKYVLSLPDTAHIVFLFVEVNHLGYKKVRQPLTEGNLVYDFVMEKKVTALPEVQVKSKPVIERHGDTLSYNVASFSRPEDRTIGDVLKHMPGITVADNGEIYYNGQRISNLYIHGDDLMAGSYTLAPKTISKDMIKNVEVISKHQPVKALRNKVLTDDVALNLVLKNENSLKLSGQAILGAGLPEQFDAALNGMLFNKKLKMLNTIKANNSGVDYADDFIQSGASSFLGSMGNSRPNGLLSAGTASTPTLPRKYYYFNRSATVNTNNLVNTRHGWQLRSNIRAFFDHHTLNYESSMDTWLPGDTIRYNERQNLVNRPFLVNTSLTATVNKERSYLSNMLGIHISGNNNNSFMDFNGNTFRQQLHERTYDLSNLFHWIPAQKGKNMMEVKWYANYYNRPQHLYIGAGLNSDMLNEGNPYTAINQYAKTPGFFSHAMVSYHTGKDVFRQAFEAGVLNERQTLRAELRLTQTDNTETDYKGDAGNDLHWQRDRVYLNSSFEIVKHSWNASIAVPLIGQTIHYYQDAYALNRRLNHFFVNPVARLNLLLNAEDDLTITYSYNNNMGNISGVYRGAILTNYRSLFANDADLQEQSNSGTGIRYKFQRAVIMLFASAGIHYSRIKANSISSTVLTNNVQRTVLLPYENDQRMLSANADISKYLSVLKATVSFKTSFNRSHYNQFINSEQLPFNNDAFACKTSIDSRIFRMVSFNYNASGIWTGSRQRNKAGAVVNKVKQFDQHVTFGYSPYKNLFLKLKGRHFYNLQATMANTSYLFLDANLRYKLIRWRMDLELDITNLANVSNFETFHLNANMFSSNSYQIRGRMAMLRATFNL
jgi:hypothetical protein